MSRARSAGASQAICRSDRIGQKKRVYVYYIDAAGTFDEAVKATCAAKLKNSEVVLCDGETSLGAQAAESYQQTAGVLCNSLKEIHAVRTGRTDYEVFSGRDRAASSRGRGGDGVKREGDEAAKREGKKQMRQVPEGKKQMRQVPPPSAQHLFQGAVAKPEPCSSGYANSSGGVPSDGGVARSGGVYGVAGCSDPAAGAGHGRRGELEEREQQQVDAAIAASLAEQQPPQQPRSRGRRPQDEGTKQPRGERDVIDLCEEGIDLCDLCESSQVTPMKASQRDTIDLISSDDEDSGAKEQMCASGNERVPVAAPTLVATPALIATPLLEHPVTTAAPGATAAPNFGILDMFD
jgi:hypothetical protein